MGKVKGEDITPEVSLWVTLYVSETHLEVLVLSSSGFFLYGQARHPGGAGGSTLIYSARRLCRRQGMLVR